MAHFYRFLPFLLLSAAASHAQIIITRNDMPNVGDTLRVSQTTTFTGPLLTQKGPNQTWNYTALRPTSQRVERYTAVSTTPGLLPFAFGSLGGVNRATIATQPPLGVLAGAGLPLTDIYLFFNESAADYRQVGYGAVLSGTALPVTYQSQQLQDVVYRFPLAYAQRDSSSSELIANVPQTAYLRQQQKRVNNADGWGTLITPFGTYATLRVVSTLQARDSISVQGQPGTVVPVPLTREYKWLGNNQGIPLLQVITQEVAGQEAVVLVEYRDVYRRPSGTLATTKRLPESAVAVYPVPAAAGEVLHLTLPGSTGLATITATDLTGRVLFRHVATASAQPLALPAGLFDGYRGVLLLRVETTEGVAVRRIVRQ
ncbi:T9SS type A sorting domain-containing protein [Hymenobacter taeanensis]|uniref:T9SS type A sorting domain-containing protein n=1 Tax=Hymenobacter taeanensis TaxID=2735321 RepID=A0A6M6BCP4_9BACT|nr:MULTISPECIES: T9SS type A sorting domain-containing protein [Hymenobacter]QJX45732.1 T9SS type A sorting domain-containing protein [Hymenobacter taeanensis]UOQ79573.1 T9SS type A sorting domain-containing protein [Hymenobacter sp. 5414T-23]